MIDDLVKLSITQHGYFTATQAESCGYNRKNHHYHVKKNHWSREGVGLYRHNSIPETEYSQYWFVFLWSRNQADQPQAIFSYETALSLQELSDVNPSKIHISMPKGFRTRRQVPNYIKIFKQTISKKNVKKIEGLPVTDVLTTLRLLETQSTVSEEILQQAVLQAIERGLIVKSEIKNHPNLLRFAI